MKFNSEGMSDRFMTQDGLQRIKSGSQDLDGRAELQMKNDLDKAIQRGYVRNQTSENWVEIVISQTSVNACEENYVWE